MVHLHTVVDPMIDLPWEPADPLTKGTFKGVVLLDHLIFYVSRASGHPANASLDGLVLGGCSRNGLSTVSLHCLDQICQAQITL